MAQELIKDGQLDKQAAVDALRNFLEKTVRAAGFQLKVTVHAVAPDAGGDAEVIADLDGRDKELLLERGAEIDARDEDSGATPLYNAASWGKLDVVKLLIDKGADVTARNKAGKTPLAAAEENGFKEVASALRARGAK